MGQAVKRPWKWTQNGETLKAGHWLKAMNMSESFMFWGMFLPTKYMKSMQLPNKALLSVLQQDLQIWELIALQKL